jgi:hypothetical protein
MTDQVKKSSAAVILLAWLVVSIPAGWGVYNTVLNAVKLFTNTAPVQSAAPAAPTAVTPQK